MLLFFFSHSKAHAASLERKFEEMQEESREDKAELKELKANIIQLKVWSLLTEGDYLWYNLECFFVSYLFRVK